MPSPPRWLLALPAGVVAALLAFGAPGVARGPRRASAAGSRAQSATAAPAQGPRDPRLWPGDEAPLALPVAELPEGSAPVRVMIDPGHGAAGNHGNTSSFCVEEQDAMLDLAEALAARLQESGHAEARLTRDEGTLVEYAARLEEAAAWGADVFVSLHSDVRGAVSRWSPAPGLDCPLAPEAPGFAVLYSDEGEPGLAARRLALGGAVARRMIEAGFLPYGGAEYAGTYARREPGVFVDRHPAGERIFVLRRAAMPSILVETHNALDPREAARWADPGTVDAFAAAVLAAFGDAAEGGALRR